MEVMILNREPVAAPSASLPGPSRRITVEPLRVPVTAPPPSVPAKPAPEPEREPSRKPAPREPVPTP